MKRETVKGLNGKEIVFLTPETPEDYKTLREMEQKKQLSTKASFGDWKNG
jgi:hypothetical protein